MPVKKKSKKKAHLNINIWNLLNDLPLEDPDDLAVFLLRDEELSALWHLYAEEIISAWVKNKPGSRPSLWWRYEAPRQKKGIFTGCFFDGKLPLERKRVGGVGTVAWKELNYAPSYYKGVPTRWYALDENNLPVFQAEADYLREHGLFLEGEADRLKAEDFDPLPLNVITKYDIVMSHDEIRAVVERNPGYHFPFKNVFKGEGGGTLYGPFTKGEDCYYPGSGNPEKESKGK